jgi:hypothetical protein
MVHMAAWPPGNEDRHDVLDGDEEQDFVLSALALADGDKGATLDAGANKRVTRGSRACSLLSPPLIRASQDRFSGSLLTTGHQSMHLAAYERRAVIQCRDHQATARVTPLVMTVRLATIQTWR